MSLPAEKAEELNPRGESFASTKPFYHYIIVRRDLPLGHMLAQSGHAAGESASWWTTERAAESIGRDLLAGDEPEDTPVWTKDHVREALDPVVGWCGNPQYWAALPENTHIVILGAKSEGHLRLLDEKLTDSRNTLGAAFPKHILITEPDAPYNGAPTAIGIYPTLNRDILKPLLSKLTLLK